MGTNAHYTHALTTADLQLKEEDGDETEDEERDLEETIEMLAVDLTLEDGANEGNAIELDLWDGK